MAIPTLLAVLLPWEIVCEKMGNVFHRNYGMEGEDEGSFSAYHNPSSDHALKSCCFSSKASLVIRCGALVVMSSVP